MPTVAKLPKETSVDPCPFTHPPVWARKPPKQPGKPLVLCLQLRLLQDHPDHLGLVILTSITKLIIGTLRPVGMLPLRRRMRQVRNHLLPPPHHKMTMPIILARNAAMKVFVPMTRAHVVVRPVMAVVQVIIITTIRFHLQRLTKPKSSRQTLPKRAIIISTTSP